MSRNLLAEHFADLKQQGETLPQLAAGQPRIRRGYLVCILPRSGSTFLTHLLRENLHYGFPDEWFNFESVHTVLKDIHITEFRPYLDYLWKERSSPEGVFGLQLSWPQLHFLTQFMSLEGVLGQDFRWFYLVRENIVLQAVSLYLAHQTGIYHDLVFDHHQERVMPAVAYDEEEIRRLVNVIDGQERAFERLFQARGIEPVRLSFEAMMKDKRSVLEQFRQALGVEHDIVTDDSATVRKLAHGANREFEQRFRAANQAFLDELSQRRRLPAR